MSLGGEGGGGHQCTVTVSKCLWGGEGEGGASVSLAAEGQDRNGLQLQKLRLNFSSCFRASSKNP